MNKGVLGLLLIIGVVIFIIDEYWPIIVVAIIIIVVIAAIIINVDKKNMPKNEDGSIMTFEQRRLLEEKERIRKKLIEKERVRNVRKDVKMELLGIKPDEFERKRERIPQNVQDKVWNRDGGKCVLCGSRDNLEFDHIIPFSKGGSNTYRNIQLLCERCNRAKSNNFG